MKAIQLTILLLLISSEKILAQQTDTIIIYDPVKVPTINKYVPIENKLLKSEPALSSVTITYKTPIFNFDEKVFTAPPKSATKALSLIPPTTLPLKSEDLQLLKTLNKKGD